MDKIDLRKQHKKYYSATSIPELVTFEEIAYIAIAGQGQPTSSEFTQAVEAIYAVTYNIKSLSKAQDQDFVVPNLEGLWWVKGDKSPLKVHQSQWFWKLLIRMPEFVTPALFTDGQLNAVTKKPHLSQISTINIEVLSEQRAVQMLHIGPYSTEPDTLSKMHQFMAENNLIQDGIHHEIYLSDPRKAVPEATKTIVRLPIK